MVFSDLEKFRKMKKTPSYSKEIFKEMIKAYEVENKAWQKIKSIYKW